MGCLKCYSLLGVLRHVWFVAGRPYDPKLLPLEATLTLISILIKIHALNQTAR